MKIEIMNRKQIEERTKLPFDNATALISCTDVDLEEVKLVHEPTMILRLQFDDVGTEDFMDFDNKLPEPEEVQRLATYHHMITDDQANKVASFYFENKEKIELLICQCEHGESRSTAIAAAIAQYENKDGIKYFIQDEYLPNKSVYRLIYNALNKIGLEKTL